MRRITLISFATLMEHVSLTLAQDTQGAEILNLMPILVYLRNEREKISGDTPPSLSKLVAEQEEIKSLELRETWFEGAERLFFCKSLTRIRLFFWQQR